MPTTEIPPRGSTPPPRLDSPPNALAARSSLTSRVSAPVDILESAPPLFLDLQDQITRSRVREAFWISLVVHLFAIIAIVNTPKLLDRGKNVAVLNARDLMHDKELTYLELPPDEQQVTKRPDTNIISDKNRIATSKNPVIDRKTLQELRDSARPGAPGRGAPSRPVAPTPPPAAGTQDQPQPSQATTAQQQPGQGNFPPRQNTQTQAKLEETPVGGSPGKGAFNMPMSAGSAIEQATRAAAATRGGFSGGTGGNYGTGIRGQSQVQSGMEVLSDTMGVDFGPYLARVLHDVRENWYNLIPEVARAPLMKKGKVSIEFAIMKDGSVQGMRLMSPSGDISLDRAAWGGITASNPFPPLPGEFGGQYLALRFHFYYNPDRSDLR
jgi:TonB family protein